MKQIIKEFLDYGNYITINRNLIKILGINTALYLSELIAKYNYFEKNNMLEDDLFYLKVDDVEKAILLSKFEQRKAREQLQNLNLIDYIKKGIPSKYFYKINFKNIFNLIEQEKNNNKDDDEKNPSGKINTPTEVKNFNLCGCKNLTYNNNNKYNNNKIIIKNNNMKSNDADFILTPNNLNKQIEDNYNSLYKKQKKEIVYPSEFREILEIWNKLPLVNKHKNLNTKLIKNTYKQIRYLLNGSFIKNNSITDDILNKYNIPLEVKEKKFTWEEIKQGLNNACLEYEEGYYPFTLEEKKKILPKNILNLFFSQYYPFKSLFLKCFYNKPVYKPELVKLKKNEHFRETELIKKQCFYNQELTVRQENKLIDVVKNLYDFTMFLRTQTIYCDITKRKWTREELDYGYFRDRVVNFNNFIEYYICFLNEIKEGWKDFETGISSFKIGTQIWNRFVEWMDSNGVILKEIDLKWYLNKKIDELVRKGELTLPEKTKEERLRELDIAIRSSNQDSFNYEILMNERRKLLAENI